jgi:DNA-binding transcriptional LysR family regulator
MLWDDRIGRRLRLKDFHTLQTIAEAGSMAKAANLLAMSQPAISKAIADMEHVLGASLLERSSRGVELTESGRILVARGRVIFDEVREGLKDIAAVADPTQGDLRIGIADVLTVVVAEIIADLSSKYPRVTYQVTINDADTTLRQLRERELDVVLTRWNPATTPDDLSFEILFHSPLAVLANKSHPLAKRKKLNLKDLMGRTVDAVTAGFVSGTLRGRYIPSQETPTSKFYRHCKLDPYEGKPAGIGKFHLGAANDNPAAPG